jgi:hypothetical protein
MLGPENAPNKTRKCRLRAGGGPGKGRGHLGGDPGRLWPPPRWPGFGRNGRGFGRRRVPWPEERPGGAGGRVRYGDAGNVTER